MADIPLQRGEAKARWMIGRIDDAGLIVTFTKDENGKHSISFVNAVTPDQVDAVTNVVMFAIGMPRCYATMVRLLMERGVNHG